MATPAWHTLSLRLLLSYSFSNIILLKQVMPKISNKFSGYHLNIWNVKENIDPIMERVLLETTLNSFSFATVRMHARSNYNKYAGLTTLINV